MRSKLIVLLGVLASSSAFAQAWDYECSFAGGKKGIRCTAEGVLFQLETIAPGAAPPNTMVIACTNGFEFESRETSGSLETGTSLLIRGTDNGTQAVIEVEDFQTQGGEFDATLKVTGDDRVRRPLRGSCEVSFTSS